MTRRADLETLLDKARDLLAASRRVAVFSGAGLSAESGLSTFRDPDPDSLWSRFDPTELASAVGFAANPERVIGWYQWRRRCLAEVAPNAAHRALAGQPGLIQITQNVDHLLEQAGVAPERVCHLHGSLIHDCCHNNGCDFVEQIDLSDPPGLRPCPKCGERLRPAVVWFGEALPTDAWQRAQTVCESVDCLLVIGTSAVVYPAASLIDIARRSGSRIIIVNPDVAALTQPGDIHLQGGAGEQLPPLIDGLTLRSTD